jgi:hypothetical protein
MKMRKATAVAFASLLVALLLGAAPASAEKDFTKYAIESAFAELSSVQAGAHADLATGFTLTSTDESPPHPQGFTRDVVVRLPPGLFGNPQAVPLCSLDEFGSGLGSCAQDAQVGVAEVTLSGDAVKTFIEPIYNLETSSGDVAARFGFYAATYPTVINVRLDPVDNTLVAAVEGASAAAEPIGVTTTFWGVPAAPIHDALRLTPSEGLAGTLPPGGRKSGRAEVPFMTNPTDCLTQRQISYTAISYQLPDTPVSLSTPFPGIGGCELVEFNPDASARTTTSQGTSGTGLGYELDLPTKGFEFPNAYMGSEVKRAEVILPEGMSVNPSQALGLGVCTESDLARETYKSAPDVGCPESSKIGTVRAHTPVLDRDAVGSLYVAKPYDNPFGSLLALYMVLKVPDRGVMVKLSGKVSLDPATGQITTVFDDIPQLPVTSFELNFREGARAPLVTPAACGPHEVISNFTPWSAPGKVVSRSSTFQVESGPDHGPCPTGGLPPFHPGLLAGTVNNAAGTHSPFNLRLTRNDSEQEITNFSIKLPPGLVGKLAGIPFCSDAAIAAAKARTSPSCPAASEIGHTLAGAGVGQVLVYVPGRIYLAGPYNGSPLSIAAVTAAKAGPFDLGTVVVREALRINPETAEVFIDAAGSDPLPHIINGVPVRLRDIRAYVDRPDFILNPTDCSPTSTASTVRGAGLDFTSEADNNPLTVTSPFQAADCGALGFKPALSIKLKGGTKRSKNPALTAVLRARPGDANIDAAQVTLPHSAFLEQGHIKTICTRVQFNSGPGNGANCPAGSVYGTAEAVTPLLDEPLKGPVFLRSSNHALPDMVAALHSGKIDINLVGRIDSGKSGGIRSSFESVPDAPVKTFTLNMFGGRRGLIVNSENLCASTNRALADFSGQNGRRHKFRPVVKPTGCKGKGKHQNGRGKR